VTGLGRRRWSRRNDLFTMATTTDIAPSYLKSYYDDLAANTKLYDEHSPCGLSAIAIPPLWSCMEKADVRVPISQGEEFYIALRFLGRDVEMVSLPTRTAYFS